MGIHGEPGIRRGKLEPADQIVDEMLEKIVADLPYENGEKLQYLLNGLGATPLDEQYIVTRRINQVLEEKESAYTNTMWENMQQRLKWLDSQSHY